MRGLCAGGMNSRTLSACFARWKAPVPSQSSTRTRPCHVSGSYSRPLPGGELEPDCACGRPSRAETRNALAGLCATYWFPVYAFIRRKGHGPEHAGDLTQEFLRCSSDRRSRHTRSSPRTTAPVPPGRMHPFSLQCSGSRPCQERGGGRAPIPIDARDGESRLSLEPAHKETAERIFERRWASHLLGQVYESLRQQYCEEGNDPLFVALWVTVSGESGRETYAVIGSRLAMTEQAVQMARHRLRRRYGKTIRGLIAETVSDPALIDDEIRDLFAALRP